MTTYAVTAVGPDGPGEVAALAEALATLGANLEDASMTRLRGHFAMTLVASVSASAAEVEQALEPVAASTGLHVSVWPVDADAPPPEDGRPWRVTLHGADRPGLVAGVARELAGSGANITDLSCRLVGDLYVMTLDVDAATEPDLAAVAARLGVTLHVVAADEDVL
ncbi:MAG: amino acid-binding protein [Frankiales bacterium]|jgi:glycine cleavage system transcriptional repressor|nr:amino acid-binding protein [Frankiales bacterium]